jgi:hypothetical protein
MFGYLSDEEASELLKECDEDEVDGSGLNIMRSSSDLLL